jgi:hypothetical integral membrane protein (TIGR02206 family)
MNQLAATQEFVAFGPSHLITLGVFAVGAVALVLIGRRQDEEEAHLFGRAMALVILAVFTVAMGYKFANPDINEMIPLQLCDVAELTAAYALWTQKRWAFSLAFFWGLVLSSQALITPDVGGPDFPAHGFLTFMGLHLLVVWTPIYLAWGRGMRPSWSTYRFTVKATLAWAAFTFTFNVLAGTNYGYLNHKPESASLMDVLGPWPVYPIVEILVVAGVWALMTWASQRGQRRIEVAVLQPVPVAA